MSSREALPVEAVRDLLGICRAMFAAGKRDHGTSKAQLDELAEIGKKLRLALKLARESSPESLGHRAAWVHADEATTRLMALIMKIGMPAAPLVEAAVIRFRTRRRVVPSERDARRAAERTRR